MEGHAWVTLATNDSYSLGALVLANSLKQVGTRHKLAVLVTHGVTNAMREKLSSVFNVVTEVNILDSQDESNLRLLKRPELGITFTKLHCWRLTQFDKCVFLDADTLVLQNCDELFERDELSAAPDVGWPDCFNSGVFVYCPSNETYDKLVQFALQKGSFDGGDQGLLNLYFSDWATKDIRYHLPFIYNLCSTACYSYLPAFKQYGENAKIVHFIGASKPWLQYFNTETRQVQPSNEFKHLENFQQRWWNIFCSLIHPQLSPEMAPSNSDTSMPRTSQNNDTQTTASTKIDICDIWEEYDLKHSIQTQENPEFEPDNSNTFHENAPDFDIPALESYPSFEPTVPEPCPSEPEVPDYCQKEPEMKEHVYVEQNVVLDHTKEPPPLSEPQESQNQTELAVCATNFTTPKPQSDECEAPVSNDETTLTSEGEANTGLAGAFAQLSLDAPRTAEQIALDDHLRRHGWESGNIDYMGRDSFENIWNKISETLSAAQNKTSVA